MMGEIQFQALANLSGWHSDSKRTEALRLHLVGGIAQADAARLAGIERNNLGNALASARATWHDASVMLGKPYKNFPTNGIKST